MRVLPLRILKLSSLLRCSSFRNLGLGYTDDSKYGSADNIQRSQMVIHSPLVADSDEFNSLVMNKLSLVL
jgi:hypothetical protein